MQDRQKPSVDRLMLKRRMIVHRINELLDTPHLCSEKDCIICMDIVKLGFLYEMITAKIREVKGLSTDIGNIMEQHIKNDLLSLHLLAQSTEYINK